MNNPSTGGETQTKTTPITASNRNSSNNNNNNTSPHQITLEPGLTLNETYRLEKLLGQGGMGQVWLANHLLLNEPRAVKFVLDSGLEERFIFVEARNALRLLHPHIVRVHDLSQYHNIPFIAMEYVAGDDLKTFLQRRGKLTTNEILLLLQPLADALNYAHGLGLVHRDIKPANILVATDGTLKLSDFGIVKDVTNMLDLTEGYYGLGTPRYMAPEQAKGQATSLSDQYALGIMLYEMLTGQTPFKGSRYAVVIQHVTVAPPPLTQFEPLIGAALSSVVLKALAKNPAERYPSVLDLANAFAQATTQPQPDSLTVAINYNSANLYPARTALPLPPHNLPGELERVLGREKEIAEISALLQEPITRLVSLTGVGGTGKTRLSLAVAGNLLGKHAFKDGIYFVPVENVTERNTLVATLVQTLGIKEVAGLDLFTVLTNFLSGKQLLLILDNFEQLVASGATLLAEVLKAAAPGLKILVTSREILNLSQEIEYKVDPLTLPAQSQGRVVVISPDSLREYAAIALFEQRARAVKADFALTDENIASVVEICNRLDGLPLAIELAAARIKILPPAKLLERLNLKLLTGGRRDLPQRQQALRSTIDWSYDLLSNSEKQLFRRLAIFAGGTTFEAADAVCNAESDLDLDLLDGLQSLLNKSLVRVLEDTTTGEFRYTMLQTIRQYALEKLEETGEVEQLSEHYSVYFVELAERLDAKLRTAEQLAALKQYDTEYANLQEVLYQVTEKRDGNHAFRLAAAMGYFWRTRGYWSEGRNYLGKALALEGAKNYRGKVLVQASDFARLQADNATAQVYAEENLNIQRELEDPAGVAQATVVLGNAVVAVDLIKAKRFYEESLPMLMKEAGSKSWLALILNNLGFISLRQANYEAATKYYEESLALRREIGIKIEIAASLSNLGAVAGMQNDLAACRRYGKESLVLRREMGDVSGIATSLYNLGLVSFNLGDYRAAQEYTEESLPLLNKVGDKTGLGRSLLTLAQVFNRQRFYQKGKQYADESIRLRRELGEKRALAEALNTKGYYALHEADFEEAQAALEESRHLYLELGDKSGIATAINNLGSVALHRGDYAAAAPLYEEAFAIRKEINDPFITYSYQALGNLANRIGKYKDARNLYIQGLQILKLKQNGANLWIAHALAGIVGSLTLPLPLADHDKDDKDVYSTVANIIGKIYALLNAVNSSDVLERPESDFYEQALEIARAALGSEGFRSGFAKGQTLSLEEIGRLLLLSETV
jgi:predicted ATPase